MTMQMTPVRWALAVGVLAAVGCGGPTNGVTGKVSFNGKPVTGGVLSFAPVSAEREAGKPGSAAVKADGTYAATTHHEGDGLIPGKHKVTYQPPELPYPPGRDPKPGEPRPKSGFEGLVAKTAEIEVKSGSNTIDIELAPRGR